MQQTSRREACLVVLAIAFGACSGGPAGIRDADPPDPPVRAQILVGVPILGIVTVQGAAGAVEPGSTVRIQNEATRHRSEGPADDLGRFQLQVPARVGDVLALSVRDASGNESETMLFATAAAARLELGAGDGQIGVAGRPLPDSLRVRVRSGSTGLGGVVVRWTQSAPDGRLVTASTETNALGLVTASYVLGSALGGQTVRAEILDGGESRSVTFAFEATGPPVVDGLVRPLATGGETIRILGRNFSPIPGHTTVRIDGNPVEILAVSRTAIEVRAPFGLAGDFLLDVGLTGVSSAPVPVRLLRAVVPPPVGHSTFRKEPGGEGTLEFAFESGTEVYLVIFESVAPTFVEYEIEDTVQPDPTEEGPPDFESRNLARGHALLDVHGPAPRVEPAPASPPIRTFRVHDFARSRYETRSARRAYDGRHADVYVDVAVPQDDFPDHEAALLGQRFETSIYGRIRDLYGTESDLDGNGKPILLITPLVNLGVEWWSAERGYFDPGDLADHGDSNRGEIVYLASPDPDGRWGTPTARADRLRESMDRDAAHGFAHMIMTNERRLLRRLPAQSFWLEEGLAHYAEHAVGRLGFSHIGTYLDFTTEWSMVFEHEVTRGISPLFLIRLADRFGPGVIGRLVRGSGTGVVTLEEATGRTFDDLFHDWAVALYNEMHPIPGVTARLGSLDLRAEGRSVRRFDMRPGEVMDLIRGSSMSYRLVRGGPNQIRTIEFRVPPEARLQITTFRLR